MKDLYHNIRVARALSPTDTTNDTPHVAEAVDGANAESVVYVILTGSLADANATFTVLLEECDTSGGTYTSVDDGDMFGTESGASFVFSDDNKCLKIGYKGQKRYTRMTITPSGNTGAALLSVAAILSGVRVGANTTQKT